MLDDVVYHEYGVPASQEECDALGVTCAKGSCVVLLNHGLLTFGETIPGALRRLYMLERACELEVIARGLDEEPAPIDPDVIRQYGERAKQQRANPEYGMTYWKAACARSRARASTGGSSLAGPRASRPRPRLVILSEASHAGCKRR